jgi:hypothetical protein
MSLLRNRRGFVAKTTRKPVVDAAQEPAEEPEEALPLEDLGNKPLGSNGPPEPASGSKVTWTGEGVLSRWTTPQSGKTARAYLRGSDIAYFLDHLPANGKVTSYDFPMCAEFKSGEFYLVMSWLRVHGLATKEGASKYLVKDRHFIKVAWNLEVDKMKI